MVLLFDRVSGYRPVPQPGVTTAVTLWVGVCNHSDLQQQPWCVWRLGVPHRGGGCVEGQLDTSGTERMEDRGNPRAATHGCPEPSARHTPIGVCVTAHMRSAHSGAEEEMAGMDKHARKAFMVEFARLLLERNGILFA